MLHEDMPPCLCGAHAWSGGGGMMSSDLCSSHFSCSSCGKPAIYLAANYCSAVFQPSGTRNEFDEQDDKFINGVVLRMWRIRGERIDDLCTEIRRAGAARIMKELGHAEGTTWRDLDKKQLETFREVLRAQEKSLAPDVNDKKILESVLEANPDLKPEPMLPGLDGRLVVRTGNKSDGWVVMDASVCREAELPQDPIRVRHDKYFDRVFAAIEEIVGHPVEREEIPNQYYSDQNNNEPWFECRDILPLFRLTIGPRKRVINIKVECHNLFCVERIRDLAAADNVTYENEGVWKGDRALSTCIVVHAWTQAKTIEYLRAIFEPILERMDRPE